MLRIASICLGLTLLSTAIYSQKKNLSFYNRLQEVEGTDYFVATYEDYNKIATITSSHLVFINTRTGGKTTVEFGKDADVGKVEQVKLDSLEINRLIVVAYYNYENKRFLDARERPRNIFILSTDGKENIKVTEDGFYPGPWAVNKRTGAIVITGYYDINKNGKHDDEDKNDILIFDLKTLKKI